jgi:hypothetical protein
MHLLQRTLKSADNQPAISGLRLLVYNKYTVCQTSNYINGLTKQAKKNDKRNDNKNHERNNQWNNYILLSYGWFSLLADITYQNYDEEEDYWLGKSTDDDDDYDNKENDDKIKWETCWVLNDGQYTLEKCAVNLVRNNNLDKIKVFIETMNNNLYWKSKDDIISLMMSEAIINNKYQIFCYLTSEFKEILNKNDQLVRLSCLAMEYKNKDILRFIIKNNSLTSNGLSESAIQTDDTEFFNILYGENWPEDPDVLHGIIERGNVSFLQEYLTKCPNVISNTLHNNTDPYMYFNHKTMIESATKSDNKDMLNLINKLSE